MVYIDGLLLHANLFLLKYKLWCKYLRDCNCLDFKLTGTIVQFQIEFGWEHCKLFDLIQGNLLYKVNIVNKDSKLSKI